MSSASLRLSSSLGKVIAATSSFATTKASSHASRSLASPSSLKQHPFVVVVPLLNLRALRRRRDVNTKAINNGMTTRNFQFSEKIQISPKHVFLETPLSFAFVNLKPVVPGHVLVCPKRVVGKYEEMTGEEISDLMLASQKVAVGESFCSLIVVVVVVDDVLIAVSFDGFCGRHSTALVFMLYSSSFASALVCFSSSSGCAHV